MKLPITDKFLWDLYTIASGVGNAFHAVRPPTTSEALSPDLRKLNNSYQKYKGSRSFAQMINYLKYNGYIREAKQKEQKGFLLTQKGAEKVLRAQFKITENKKRKDSKWVMVIFDIPERKKIERDSFRNLLQEMGFEMLQRSIWVCPYDKYEDTQKVSSALNIQSYIRIFLIEEIEA